MISKSNCLSNAAAATFLCATSAFAQENHGTLEQRAVCAPDAYRLCAGYIPDPTRVEHCLRQNKSERRVPIGVRTKCRPGGQQSQITESGCPIGGRPKFLRKGGRDPV
jgi:hypothetical protein